MFVSAYGAKKLADTISQRWPELRVSVRAVYGWTAGTYEPRGRKLRAILELADGQLTAGDIHDHFAVLASEKKLSGRE